MLLVDDNDVNLNLLCAFVEKDGFEYKSAKDGAQAVDMYKAHPGVFQVVIIGMYLFITIVLSIPATRLLLKFCSIGNTHTVRSFNARNGWLRGFAGNPPLGERASCWDVRIRSTRIPTHNHPALTGLDSAGAQKEAFGSGINTFLVKPVKRPELQAILPRQL